MSRATGVLLMLLGVWLVVASLAGRLGERILALAPVGPQLPEGAKGQGGNLTGVTDPTTGQLQGSTGGGGGGGGGGGAW